MGDDLEDSLGEDDDDEDGELSRISRLACHELSPSDTSLCLRKSV